MNRSLYFDYISNKLNAHTLEIESNGKLNLLHLHIHSENFYAHLLNELFGWKTRNENSFQQNVEAVDLMDTENKFIIQISATNTKQKIENSLNKEKLRNYVGYTFKFISIAKNADNLRGTTFINPHGISFDPQNDIIDKQSILNEILTLHIDKLKTIYELIKKELGSEVDIVRLESNLASIINILSREDLGQFETSLSIDPFQIERKISYNNLNRASYVITDYKIHYNKVNKIYSEFDKSGSNKSISVLSAIRNEYIRNLHILQDDDLFFNVINEVENKVINSANFVTIPIDELELCVNILVVDAFIRCKIFKNPENYHYVTS